MNKDIIEELISDGIIKEKYDTTFNNLLNGIYYNGRDYFKENIIKQTESINSKLNCLLDIIDKLVEEIDPDIKKDINQKILKNIIGNKNM